MVSPFGRGFESLQLHLNEKERTINLFALFIYQDCLFIIEICFLKGILATTIKTMCADHFLWQSDGFNQCF